MSLIKVLYRDYEGRPFDKAGYIVHVETTDENGTTALIADKETRVFRIRHYTDLLFDGWRD